MTSDEILNKFKPSFLFRDPVTSRLLICTKNKDTTPTFKTYPDLSWDFYDRNNYESYSSFLEGLIFITDGVAFSKRRKGRTQAKVEKLKAEYPELFI